MAEIIEDTNATVFLRQLEELNGLYGELLELSRRQCETVYSYDGMPAMLAEKQAVMRKIDAAGLNLSTLPQRWLDMRVALSEELSAAAGETIRALKNTLREIVAAENQWHEKCAARKDGMLDHICELEARREMALAYSRAAGNARMRKKLLSYGGFAVLPGRVEPKGSAAIYT